ncbi:MAG: hypothetical protein K5785_01005 [Nitrosarchaeum sp.]|nr:hypothetical protein [Nitrosarchaeum sp.]
MSFKWVSNSNVKLEVMFDEIGNKYSHLGPKILTALGNRLVDLIQENAPYSSGAYAEGWKLDQVSQTKAIISNPDGKKFTILEFTGKRPTHIEAKRAKALHFVIDGQDVFVKFSNPGGFAAKPHVRPAMKQLMREARDIIYAVLGDELKMFKEVAKPYKLKASRTVQKKTGRKRLRRKGSFRSKNVT